MMLDGFLGRKMRFIILIFLLTHTISAAKQGEVFVNTTNGRDYYHLLLSLKKDDFRLTWPDEWFDPQWPESTSGSCKFSDESGGFVIFLRKSALPVPAPNCNSDWLKVVMDGRSRSAEEVQTKRKVWDQVVAVKNREQLQTPVVLELNPYVKILSTDPLLVELEYCNLYFRTAWGKYVDHLASVEDSVWDH